VGGLVLLVLIGVLVAWLVTRGRQKMKLPVGGKHWAWIIIAVVLVLAIAYGASGHVSPH
jgi:drug/metabolite transporter (DMT)-like permease